MVWPPGPHRRSVLAGLVAALAASGLLASCPSATTNDQETTMTERDPIERLEAAINSHDPQRIADCFTPDYRCETPHRPEDGFTGSDRVRANWVAILARIPDLRAKVLRRPPPVRNSGRSGRWWAPDRTATAPCSPDPSS